MSESTTSRKAAIWIPFFSSLIAVARKGELGLLSGCEEYLGIPLSRCRGIGPHHKLRQETRGVLSSCDMDLGVPIEFQKGSRGLSCVQAWNSAFLFSCDRGVRPPVKLRPGTKDFS